MVFWSSRGVRWGVRWEVRLGGGHGSLLGEPRDWRVPQVVLIFTYVHQCVIRALISAIPRPGIGIRSDGFTRMPARDSSSSILKGSSTDWISARSSEYEHSAAYLLRRVLQDFSAELNAILEYDVLYAWEARAGSDGSAWHSIILGAELLGFYMYRASLSQRRTSWEVGVLSLTR